MKPKLSIDGVKRTIARPKPRTAVPKQVPVAPPPQRHYAQPNRATAGKPKKRMLLLLQVTLAVPLFILASFLIQSSIFGQLAIVVYGVVAFVRRIPSRTTFTLALLSLTVTAFVLLTQGNIGMSQNFATYTFLFLVAGVLTLGRELKNEGGRIYSSRQSKS